MGVDLVKPDLATCMDVIRASAEGNDIALPEGDYTLIDKRGWFTIGPFAVCLRMKQDRLHCSVYPLGREDAPEIGGCIVDKGALP
jgi:hypothetical protein